MIVGSEVSEQLETQLVGDGWEMLWVYDAKSAIARVRRERFDLVVLISTGKEMDVVETFFNLADIQKTLPVFLFAKPKELTTRSKVNIACCRMPGSNRLKEWTV
jgi:DNA-binding response OmpR family regulator